MPPILHTSLTSPQSSARRTVPPQPMTVILRIIGITLRYKRRLLAAYVATAVATAAYLFLPRLIGNSIDRVVEGFESGNGTAADVLPLALAILALSVARGIASYAQTYLGESLSLIVAYKLRNAFYDRVQRLSFAFHDRHHTGQLMSRAISDVEAVRMFVNMGLVRAPHFAILFTAVAVILLRLDWKLGLISMSFMPVIAYNSGVARVRMRRLWLATQEKMAELSTVLQENLSGVRVVKAFGSEPFEEAKFDQKNTEVATEMVKAERLRASTVSFMGFVLLIAVGLILAYGGWQVINGNMTEGELTQFIIYTQILSMPVRMVGWLVNSYARASSAGQRLFEILDAESPVRESPDAVEMPRAAGLVRFDDVSFGYDGRAPAVKGVSFEARPGQTVALLGAPGSGKSTVVHLLPRFYDVTAGRITLDGRDIRQATLKSLRRNIALVQQDVFLFTATIRENIAYGREEASTDEIVEAARIAQLDDFIRTLDRGYDTVIGERGATLSGGQRQRLAIARALLVDPPVLVLDDSTSSVDASTEELIHRAMEAVMRDRTVFVIAHRLSTVHKADLILVLKDGEVVERGRHQDLLAAGGLYRGIYELQLRPQEEVMLDFEAPEPVDRSAAR